MAIEQQEVAGWLNAASRARQFGEAGRSLQSESDAAVGVRSAASSHGRRGEIPAGTARKAVAKFSKIPVSQGMERPLFSVRAG
jgi:hypothetical protein